MSPGLALTDVAALPPSVTSLTSFMSMGVMAAAPAPLVRLRPAEPRDAPAIAVVAAASPGDALLYVKAALRVRALCAPLLAPAGTCTLTTRHTFWPAVTDSAPVMTVSLLLMTPLQLLSR